MKLIFVGVQASGKGTQGELVAKKFGIPHISMGDLLRNYSGKYKKQIDETVKKGNLISIEWSLEIIRERISEADCKNGFILDGFPRNIEQAKGLDKITKIDKVVEIVISDAEALRRLMGRRICPKCGTSYNIVTEPKPKHDNVCDKDGTKLIQRADDNEESIKNRLKIYHEETEPILDFYRGKVLKINGEKHIEEVQREILKKLRN